MGFLTTRIDPAAIPNGSSVASFSTFPFHRAISLVSLKAFGIVSGFFRILEAFLKDSRRHSISRNHRCMPWKLAR